MVTAEGPQKKTEKYHVDELYLVDAKQLERDQLLVDHLIFKAKRISLPQLVRDQLSFDFVIVPGFAIAPERHLNNVLVVKVCQS